VPSTVVSRYWLKVARSVCPQFGDVVEFASVMNFLQGNDNTRRFGRMRSEGSFLL
jgi:hypothetical protein